MTTIVRNISSWFCSTRSGGIQVGAAVLALVTALAYRGTLDVPFIFDDFPSIVENPNILHLWPTADPLTPPPSGGLTTAGRPLVSLSLAINYACDGFRVRGYHLFNLATHILAGWTLLGVVRRTLLLPKLSGHFGDASWPLSLSIAVLWSVHPLNTESVTYIVQRAELLAGLFILLTLYCFARSISDGKNWLALSALSCFLAVASKEVGAITPLLILCYDRTFLAGTFKGALLKRHGYYLALGGSWILQSLLIFGTGGRGGTIGYMNGIPWWKYPLTQTWAISNYLKLSIWPDPLIFDYGTTLITNPLQIAFSLPLVIVLAGLTIYCFLQRRPISFAGLAFFLILAPSSSFLPVLTQTIAEHRMYLPLMSVVAVAVLSIYRWIGQHAYIVCVGMISAACILTQLRNDDYKSDFSIWKDTLTKQPQNARAWKNLGILFAAQGRYAAALSLFEQAERLQPYDDEVHFNLAYTKAKLGRFLDAAEHYRIAIKIHPANFQACNNLGNLLLADKEYDKAIQQYGLALKANPNYADAYYNLGRALLATGKKEEAVVQIEKAVRLNPNILNNRWLSD